MISYIILNELLENQQLSERWRKFPNPKASRWERGPGCAEAHRHQGPVTESSVLGCQAGSLQSAEGISFVWRNARNSSMCIVGGQYDFHVQLESLAEADLSFSD